MSCTAKILLCVLILGLCLTETRAQTTIKGKVFDTNNSQALPFVNVYWQGSTKGTTTNQKGEFSITKTDKNKRLIFRFIGYEADTIVVGESKEDLSVYLTQMSTTLGSVSVNERVQSTIISKLSTQNTEIITAEGLKHLACCNLGESFQNSASVDVGYSDAVSGAKQIQLLGLTGVYSQLLLENTPFLTGLSAPFGLNYVPGSWMQSISVSKGVASVINGYESITGQINLEYDKPKNGDAFYFNLYTNSDANMEMNAKSNIKINEHLYTGLFLHASYFNNAMDKLGSDGFMDYPNQRQINIGNRWHYEKGNFISQSFINYLHEDRVGGQMGFKTSMRGDTNLYGLGAQVDRLHFFSKNCIVFSNGTSLGSQLSGTFFRNDAFFGVNNYLGRENDLYANLIYSGETRQAHQYTLGASVKYDRISEDYSLLKQTDKEEIIPGVFGNFTFLYGKKFSTTASLRYDYNTYYNKNIITPRLHARWQITDYLVLRGNVGKGYRSANVLADNFGLLASSRQIIIFNNQTLKMEDATNGGVNITYTLKTKDKRENSITLDYYHTNFKNQIVLDLDQDAHKAYIYNLEGKSYSNSAQMSINLEPVQRFNITLAARVNDVKTNYNGRLLEKPYVSKYKGLVVLSYKTKYNKWTFDLTTQFNGRERLPLNMGEKQGYSNGYVYMLGQITRKFKYFDIYAGCENITNYTQKHLVTGYTEPFSNNFDASIVYAPLMGRTFYVGVRMSIL